MRRMTLAGLLLGLVLSWATSEALVDHGELCFQMNPFDDVMIVSRLQSRGAHAIFSLPAQWSGANQYRMDGHGTANTRLNHETHVEEAQQYQIGLSFINHSAIFFGGNPLCTFRATFAPDPMQPSPWDLVCIGGATPFTLQSDEDLTLGLEVVPCPAPGEFTVAEIASGVFVNARGEEAWLAGDPRTWRGQ